MSYLHLHGFVIDSEVPLAAPAATAGSKSDLTIRWGTPRPGLPADARRVARHEVGANRYSAWSFEQGHLLRFPGVCDFRIDAALQHIEVAPADPSRRPLAALLLPGTCLSLWLGLRGHAVVHANAVASPSGTIALMGASGAGKSTTTALLASRGWTLLADDALRLDVQDGRVRCHPGLRQVRLRRSSAAAANLIAAWPRNVSADGRVCLQDVSDGPKGSVALDAVFWLRKRGAETRTERLRGTEAVLALLGQARLSGWCDGGALTLLTARLSATARALPVFALDTRPGPPFDGLLAAELESAVLEAMARAGESRGATA